MASDKYCCCIFVVNLFVRARRQNERQHFGGKSALTGGQEKALDFGRRQLSYFLDESEKIDLSSEPFPAK